jgi:hypothetical protein
MGGDEARGSGPCSEKRYPHSLAAILIVFVGVSCATPIAPTGGPADDVPPRLVASDPAADAVRVLRSEWTLTFSERIDEASFRRALSIVPEPALPPQVRVKKRTASISVGDSLRPNTTYLVTLDTELKDAHGVRVTRPITYAFATGENIDKGTIRGVVVEGISGRPVSGVDVFAYSANRDTTAGSTSTARRAEYRTQTGPDGAFTLEYLPRRAFFVVAVRDQNGNRMFDEGERFAVPPYPSIAPVPEDSTRHPGLWYLADADTTAPDVRSVRARWATRVEIGYTEPVRLRSTDVDEWVLTDSLEATRYAVRAVYQDADDQNQVMLWTDSLGSRAFRLELPPVADSAGNASPADTAIFTGSRRQDTTTVRLRAFGPRRAPGAGTPITLFPGVHPSLTLSSVVSNEVLDGAISVFGADSSLVSFARETGNNTTHHLIIDGEVSADTVVVQVATLDARVDTTYRARYVRMKPEELGTLSGVAVGSDRRVAEILAEDRFAGRVEAVAVDSAGAYSFELPGGRYRVGLFADADSSLTWTGGYPAPYRRAELRVWSDTVRVRPKWETVVDTLFLEGKSNGRGPSR